MAYLNGSSQNVPLGWPLRRTLFEPRTSPIQRSTANHYIATRGVGVVMGKSSRGLFISGPMFDREPPECYSGPLQLPSLVKAAMLFSVDNWNSGLARGNKYSCKI